MALADLRKLAPGESPACSCRTETIMAKQVEECTIGVDVAKGWLDIYAADRKALAPVEASCNAGADESSVATEPGRYRCAG